jgi:radical SAM protein with 4Fe4S-binding SPASM domain
MSSKHTYIDKLYKSLALQWNIKSFIDLGSMTVSPQVLFQTLDKCYQPVFEPKDKLIFYTSHQIPQELLIHLYRATNLMDVSNFFILLCTPYDISTLVFDTANTYSTDPVPFQLLTVPELDNTKVLSEDYVFPDTMCPLPWMHLEINHSGSIRPCCVFQGTVGNVNDQDINDVFNNQDMQALRHSFLNGQKPQGCKVCWDNEQQGLSSNRTYHSVFFKKTLLTQFLSDPKITSVDLKPGNTCNFKCRICGPESSSLHADERNRFLKIDSPKTSIWIDNEHCVEQLIELLPNLKNIDMYGGEPFLIKKFDLLLKSAVDQNHANHIRLHYNTNGSIYPHHLIKYWKHFQHIDIQVSIDNIGRRFELERGGSWSAVEHNIKKMLDLNLPNLSISIMPTINIMNVFYIGELVSWANSLGLKLNPLYVHYPEEFSIKNLTRSAKQLLKEKYQNHAWPEIKHVLDSIELSPDNNGAGFVNKTRYFDSVRHENFAETHPEIAKAMGYVYNKDL